MIAVIGDIHGCYFTLNELVDKVLGKYPAIKIYSVGDLVDRGNYSYEVIEFVNSMGIRFTPGNHDYMFCHFIKQTNNKMANAWLYNGYEKTIASYNRHDDQVSEHLELIMKAPLFFNSKDCFISHAGISKSYETILPEYFRSDLNILENIIRNDLEKSDSILWARGELLNIGKLQVVGHTRRNNVEFKKENNVVYIDTSVYLMNKLSAVIIEDSKILDIISVATRPEDMK
ncbi:MAG: metallophosphoesterase [Ignavibacteriaceae bacterium]|jgi:serine/threonine protein phosphatase 1